MTRKKKATKQEKPEAHENLKGFDIKINEFGEIVSSLQIDKLSKFLNENVADKKLRSNEEEE